MRTVPTYALIFNIQVLAKALHSSIRGIIIIYLKLRGFLIKQREGFLLLERLYFMPNMVFGFLFNIAWGVCELKAMRYKSYRLAKKKSKKSMLLTDLISTSDLRERLAPEGIFIVLFRKGSELKFSNTLSKVIEWVDLLGRGYTDKDIWNLSESLALKTGQQLLELERVSHGWPESSEFKTFEDWSNALTTHGNALIRYGSGEEDNSRLLAIAEKLKNAGEEEEYQEIIKRIENQDLLIQEDARLAYLFISNNFALLWD